MLADFRSTSSTNKVSAAPETVISGPCSPYDVDAAEHFEPDERRLVELRLLHHFLTVVAVTFPTANTAHLGEIWTKSAPQMAFTHTFLLNCMLAMSALHLATVARPEKASPEESPRYVDDAKAHRIYLSLAVREQREALSQLSTSSAADAVCLSSIVLSIIALARPSIQPAGPYTPPMQWLNLAIGMASVIQVTIPLLTDNGVVERVIDLTEPDFRDRTALFHPRFLAPFQSILDFTDTRPSSTDSGPEPMETYRLALTYIGSVHDAILRDEPIHMVCHRLMSFIGLVTLEGTEKGVLPTQQFTSLLEARRPRALVIFACLMCMAAYVESYWWFAGAAEREVKGIQTVLPPEWQWAMQWPLNMLRQLSLGPTQRSSQTKPSHPDQGYATPHDSWCCHIVRRLLLRMLSQDCPWASPACSEGLSTSLSAPAGSGIRSTFDSSSALSLLLLSSTRASSRGFRPTNTANMPKSYVDLRHPARTKATQNRPFVDRTPVISGPKLCAEVLTMFTVPITTVRSVGRTMADRKAERGATSID